MKAYKVLTINPGSTSTKVALFEGDQCLYSRNVSHEANELGKFKTLPEQLPYRRDTILRLLKEAGISLWMYLWAGAAVCWPWRAEPMG